MERDYLILPEHPDPCEPIIYEIAAQHGVTRAELEGDCRGSRVARVRWEIWSRLRREHGLSYLQLGALFNRDHTTAMYGVKQYDNMRAGG